MAGPTSADPPSLHKSPQQDYPGPAAAECPERGKSSLHAAFSVEQSTGESALRWSWWWYCCGAERPRVAHASSAPRPWNPPLTAPSDRSRRPFPWLCSFALIPFANPLLVTTPRLLCCLPFGAPLLTLLTHSLLRTPIRTNPPLPASISHEPAPSLHYGLPTIHNSIISPTFDFTSTLPHLT